MYLLSATGCSKLRNMSVPRRILERLVDHQLPAGDDVVRGRRACRPESGVRIEAEAEGPLVGEICQCVASAGMYSSVVGCSPSSVSYTSPCSIAFQAETLGPMYRASRESRSSPSRNTPPLTAARIADEVEVRVRLPALAA